MEELREIMRQKVSVKYLKIEESTLYKMAREENIPIVKIEFGKDDKVIILVPYDQEFIKNIKMTPIRSGIALRYIQELLCHAHSKTTEIYTHVSTKNLRKIISPIDTLNFNGGLKNENIWYKGNISEPDVDILSKLASYPNPKCGYKRVIRNAIIGGNI